MRASGILAQSMWIPTNKLLAPVPTINEVHCSCKEDVSVDFRVDREDASHKQITCRECRLILIAGAISLKGKVLMVTF